MNHSEAAVNALRSALTLVNSAVPPPEMVARSMWLASEARVKELEKAITSYLDAHYAAPTYDDADLIRARGVLKHVVDWEAK